MCAMMRWERQERGRFRSTRQTTSESPFGPEKAEAEAEGNGLPMATKILGARRAEEDVLGNRGENRGKD